MIKIFIIIVSIIVPFLQVSDSIAKDYSPYRDSFKLNILDGLDGICLYLKVAVQKNMDLYDFGYSPKCNYLSENIENISFYIDVTFNYNAWVKSYNPKTRSITVKLETPSYFSLRENDPLAPKLLVYSKSVYNVRVADDVADDYITSRINHYLPVEFIYHFEPLVADDPEFDPGNNQDVQLAMIIDRFQLINKRGLFGVRTLGEYIRPKNEGYSEIVKQRRVEALKAANEVNIFGIKVYNSTKDDIVPRMEKVGFILQSDLGNRVTFDSSKLVQGSKNLSFSFDPSGHLALIRYVFPSSMYNELSSKLDNKYVHQRHSFWKAGWINIRLSRDISKAILEYDIRPYYDSWLKSGPQADAF